MTDSIRPIGAAHFNLRDLPTTRPDALNRLDELPSGDDEAGELSAGKGLLDSATFLEMAGSVLNPQPSLAKKQEVLMEVHVATVQLGLLSSVATKLADAIAKLGNT